MNLMGKSVNVEIGQTKLFVGITIYTIGLNVLGLWRQNNWFVKNDLYVSGDLSVLLNFWSFVICVEGMNSFRKGNSCLNISLWHLNCRYCWKPSVGRVLAVHLLKFLGYFVSLTFPFLIKNHAYALKDEMFYYSVCHMQACTCMCIFSVWLVHISFIIILIFFLCLISFWRRYLKISYCD